MTNAIVFLLPQDLKPEPKNNHKVMLAYWNRGLYSRLGQVWCAGATFEQNG